MDRMEASDALDAGSIPVGCINVRKVLNMEKFAKNHNEFWGKVKEYLDQAKKWFLQNK